MNEEIKEKLIDWIDRPPSNSDLDFINEILELQQENEQLKKRNKEIYDGFLATQEELTEYAIENEELKKQKDDVVEYIKEYKKILEEGNNKGADYVVINSIYQRIEDLLRMLGEIQKCFKNGRNKSLENKPFKEDKKIEKIRYYDDSIAWVIDGAGQLSNIDKIAIDKINEIIDYLMENK